MASELTMRAVYAPRAMTNTGQGNKVGTGVFSCPCEQTSAVLQSRSGVLLALPAGVESDRGIPTVSGATSRGSGENALLRESAMDCAVWLPGGIGLIAGIHLIP